MERIDRAKRAQNIWQWAKTMVSRGWDGWDKGVLWHEIAKLESPDVNEVESLYSYLGEKRIIAVCNECKTTGADLVIIRFGKDITTDICVDCVNKAHELATKRSCDNCLAPSSCVLSSMYGCDDCCDHDDGCIVL